MEPVCTEYQPNNFVIGAVEYPFWEQEDAWDGYFEPCNTEYANPFDDVSAESSFDGAMNWAEGCEHSYYTHNSNSNSSNNSSNNNNAMSPPVAMYPPVEAAETIISTPAEAPPTQSQGTPRTLANPPTTPKRKRKQAQGPGEPASTAEPRPKRPCRSRSRSTSFSPATNINLDLLAGGDGEEKEGVYLERSRVASNKFRERKRNEIALLESEEYNIEDVNRQLRGMLDALTSEILSLKMQILQHTNCNCELIQAYISKEAHHFVKSLQGVAKG